MPKAKLKLGKDMAAVKNEPFEYKLLSKTLIQYSMRPNHIAILGVDEFKEKYELIPEEPAQDSPAQPS